MKRKRTHPPLLTLPIHSGKRPTFLQGERTSKDSLKRIRRQLKQAQVFTETIINYRANGEAYLCKVSIYPLLNQQQQITHFLALEQEL